MSDHNSNTLQFWLCSCRLASYKISKNAKWTLVILKYLTLPKIDSLKKKGLC